MKDFSGNEAFYPPSPSVARAVAAHLGEINRYVTPGETGSLKEALSTYTGVAAEKIFPGSGSHYLLNQLLGGLRAQKNLVSTHPGILSGIAMSRYPGKKLRRIQLEPPVFSLEKMASTEDAAIYLLDRPNDPTGQSLITVDRIQELLSHSENRVVIDEAYSEYAEETLQSLVSEYPNLGILRTLDKAFGLGGLRVSYLLLGKTLKEEIRDIPPLINRPALTGALAALGDIGYMAAKVKDVKEERHRLAGELEDLGLRVYPSSANFVLFFCQDHDLALKLKARGFLIADVSANWFQGHYRITVRGPGDNASLIAAMREVLEM